MAENLHLKPAFGHVRYRMGTAPNYQLAAQNNVAQLAATLAETFSLKANSFTFNQNALSTQFLSFRYVLPVEAPGVSLAQFPYLDVMLGVDQVELVFSNPPTVQSLRETYLRTLTPMFSVAATNALDHYFEASFHAPSDIGTVQNFFDGVVKIPTKLPVETGFSFALTLGNNARAAMNLDRSAVLKGGIFIFFTYTLAQKASDISAIGEIMKSALHAYREFQSVANVQLDEPTESHK